VHFLFPELGFPLVGGVDAMTVAISALPSLIAADGGAAMLVGADAVVAGSCANSRCVFRRTMALHAWICVLLVQWMLWCEEAMDAFHICVGGT